MIEVCDGPPIFQPITKAELLHLRLRLAIEKLAIFGRATNYSNMTVDIAHYHMATAEVGARFLLC